jgi:hypothetical protein
MSFRFSLKTFSRSALAGGPFFFSEPEPGLGGPDRRKYLFSSFHSCICTCMTSEVGAVQCIPFSGFVTLVCKHLVVLRREIGSLQGLYEHSARQTLKFRTHPLPRWDCHPRSVCSEGTSRQHTPYTDRPLWPAELILRLSNNWT